MLLILAALPAIADDGAAQNGRLDRVPILSALYAAPMPELVPTAINIVQYAKPQLVEPTVREVVRDTIRVSRPAAVPVVEGIASAKPEMAAMAAGTAAVLVPTEAISVAQGAAVSAPSQAGRIVQMVCEAAPKQYKEIVIVVTKAAPGEGKEILDGLIMARPDLKDKLTQALSECSGANSTNCINAILQGIGDQTAVAASDPPLHGVNIVPMTATPNPLPLTQPFFDLPGGRNYSPP